MPVERMPKPAAVERERGQHLREQGTIRMILRLPGRTANIGIRVADSATKAHELISSFPLYDWMDVEVPALAPHPLESESA